MNEMKERLRGYASAPLATLRGIIYRSEVSVAADCRSRFGVGEIPGY